MAPSFRVPGVGPSLCPLSLNVFDSDSLGQRNKGLLCSTLRHFYFACLSRRSHRSQYPVLKVRPRRLRPSRGTRRPQRRDEIYAPPGPPARGRGRLHGTHTTRIELNFPSLRWVSNVPVPFCPHITKKALGGLTTKRLFYIYMHSPQRLDPHVRTPALKLSRCP